MYWVIETHADDGYLSMHGHIQLWGPSDITLVTVYADKKREAEARAYATAVGCGYRCLSCVESGSMKRKPGIVPALVFWNLPIRKYDKLIFPLGLDHPEHQLVASMAPFDAWYYLDMPCCTKLKVTDELQEKTRNLTIVSALPVGKRKWKHIPLFKSQAKYFHFNPPETLPKLEMIFHA